MNLCTPTLNVIDNRSLNVRQVHYCQLPNAAQAQTRVHRRHYDAAGHLLSEHDPRLSAATPNQTHLHSLSGARLLSQNVDAGWRIELRGQAAQVVRQWDQRGGQWQTDYDPLLRPIARHEWSGQLPRRTLEHLVYGDNSQTSAQHNQCGRLIQHFDTAGSVAMPDYGLLSAPLTQVRCFVQGLEPVDWPLSQLEPNDHTTHWQYNALNEVLMQTDAKGHRQLYALDIAGQLKSASLQLRHAAVAQTVIDTLHYNAAGQPLGHRAGNGVSSHLAFNPSDGRLVHIKAVKSAQVFQDMSYEYDSVGNIVSLNDHVQPTRYFSNQRVDGSRQFTYDSLNQLITATGAETVGATTRPQLPDLITPIDLTRRSRYTQHYTYDDGGNLTKREHISPIPGQSHTCVMDIAPQSNRAVSWTRSDSTALTMDYDVNGNLQALQPGAQPLQWNLLDQLQRVTMLHREEAEDDFEHYLYASDGQRMYKWRSTRAASVTHIHKQYYLPGLEVRTQDGRESLHVINLQAGIGQVCCLHWPEGAPDGIEQDALRYSLRDHQDSSLIELDGEAQLISQEAYYPFGGTAWWAARSQVHASYKTLRYSGKERDSSGLYYYGARYYAPWLSRWINADPSGTADGLNLYCMAHNNPINKVDGRGENAEIAYLIAGTATLVAIGAAALLSKKASPSLGAETVLPPLDFELHPTERENLQAFSKQSPTGQSVEVRKLGDGSVWAYRPKNLTHATNLSNASDINLQKQISKPGYPAIKLREAPPPPAKKAAAPTPYTAFEVATTTKASSKKAERIAAVEEVVQASVQSTSTGPVGAEVDETQFRLSRHFQKWSPEQQAKITGVLDEIRISRFAANNHRYSHDREVDQNIPVEMGKPKVMRDIHTVDVTFFDGAAGGRGDWRLVMYLIDGVYYPQRMASHRDIVNRARR